MMRAHLLVSRNLVVYRRAWPVLVTGFFEPLFYLLSIGIGLGSLTGPVDGVPYPVYVAPALLAASAMNGAVYDTTMNVYWKLKNLKLYDTVVTTPLGPGDIAVAEIAWALARGVVYSTVFLGVMTVLGYVGSPWALLALPAAALVGFAFAATGMAATTFWRSWQDFEFVQLVTLPLFLFSTTFYPLGTYPRWLQLVVECTPLFHGVTLTRGLVLGRPSWGMLASAAYLAVLGVVGVVVVGRRLRGLLLP